MPVNDDKKITLALLEDFEDFFEQALCGYLNLDPNGKVIRVNKRISEWTGLEPSSLKGKRFSDLLTVGGKIYYETHLAPMLRMQGYFTEIALEITGTGNKPMPVLVNGYERRDQNNEVQFIRLAVFKASDRMRYEQNLQSAKNSAENKFATALELSVWREQFIAVLGHDLRNPLQAIMQAAEILKMETTDKEIASISRVLTNSSSRMNELINKIMDFAQAKMGGGLVVEKQGTEIGPIISQIIEELQLAWPQRIIRTEMKVSGPIFCDGPRIAQLASNLLANALTHGAQDRPVILTAQGGNETFELSVTNEGVPIATEMIPLLFQPFTRETARPSHHGLGLGLYIAAEIARAHGGEITAKSTSERTTFTFRMRWTQ